MNEECRGDDEGEDLEGRYANYFKVGHNAFEFVLDFGQFYPESGQPRLHTRIVTNPIYARALSNTILESLGRYEETFGCIPRSRDDWPAT
jgi:Protein of unknown function (DUF3467)